MLLPLPSGEGYLIVGAAAMNLPKLMDEYPQLIARVKFYPPDDLFLPGIQVKVNQKGVGPVTVITIYLTLIFQVMALCRTCAEENNRERSCEHLPEARAITNYCTKREIQWALKNGYKLATCYDALVFPSESMVLRSATLEPLSIFINEHKQVHRENVRFRLGEAARREGRSGAAQSPAPTATVQALAPLQFDGRRASRIRSR